MTERSLDNALIETALRTMFEKGWFSITTIDSILSVTNGLKKQSVYDRLRLLHCVNFNTMPAQVLEALPDMIREVIDAPAFDVEACCRPRTRSARVIDITPTSERKRSGLLGFFK